MLIKVFFLNLSINKYDVYIIAGKNGSGKSTLLKSIAGLIPINSGEIEWQKNSKFCLIAPYVFPFMDLTAKENLVFFGNLYGLQGTLLTKKVNEILEIIGLDDGKANQYSKYFSANWRNRAAIGNYRFYTNTTHRFCRK